MGNRGNLGGKRKKCRKERVGPVAVNPDNLESNKGAAMCVFVCVCVCVCVCVFIKLHITTQSGPVCVCLCVCVCVCVFIKLHITTQSGLVILVILCHSR